MTTSTSNRSGYLSIAFGLLMISTGPIFVKTIQANGFLVAFWRMAFAALILTGIMLLRGKGRWHLALGTGLAPGSRGRGGPHDQYRPVVHGAQLTCRSPM